MGHCTPAGGWPEWLGVLAANEDESQRVPGRGRLAATLASPTLRRGRSARTTSLLSAPVPDHLDGVLQPELLLEEREDPGVPPTDHGEVRRPAGLRHGELCRAARWCPAPRRARIRHSSAT